MTLAWPKIAYTAWRVLPISLRRRLRTTPVKRFVRFAPAAVLALFASQITYFICNGPAGLTAGIAGAAGWFAGAAVSYIVSRWAWERKGRPQLLKETLPFWAVSICVGVVLTLASKFGSHQAQVLGLTGAARQLFTQGVYLAANCLTFLTRFMIFHYVLFADRNAPALAAPPAPPAGASRGRGLGSAAEGDPDALALARASAPVRGPGQHRHTS